MIRAFVLDDEELAVKRLVRLLVETGRVEVSGSSTDPIDALAALNEKPVEVLFPDIQMPGMTGFEMLAYLDPQPLVVFTTAFDQYALRAFEVNSIDYLLKPIEASQLARALDKIERLRAAPSPPADWKALLEALMQSSPSAYPERIASRTGERIQIIDLAKVTHFFSQDKLTYAATESKNYVIDHAVGVGLLHVGRIRQRADHHDRHVVELGPLTDALQHAEAVERRQDQIQGHQRWPPRRQVGQRGRPVAGRDDVHAQGLGERLE